MLVALSMAAYAGYFGWLSLMSYWAFQMHALDMGNMAQAAWNTVHGHPFAFTNMRMPYAIEAWRTTTRLSFHVEADFPLVSAVYLAFPRPESLLILQTVGISLGAWPTYLLARDVLGHSWLAAAFAVVYLLFPSLEALNLYEFHVVAFAPPLLLAAFLFIWRRTYPGFALFALLAMGTKEQIGLVIAMFGLYIAFVNGDRLLGLSSAVIGSAWSLVAALLIEKHFRQPGTITYLHSRYGYLGRGLHGVMHTLLHQPGTIWSTVVTLSHLGYALRLLLPTGLLSLLAPQALVLGAPTFVLNVFSSDFHMSSGVGDNSAELVAISMIAAILGAKLIISWLWPRLDNGRSAIVVALYLLASALISQRAYGYTPIGALAFIPSIGSHQRLASHFVAMIPPSAPVSTQDQLDPHLADRRYLYLFPDTGREWMTLPPANDILLDVSAPTYPIPSYQIHDAAMNWLRRPGWGVAAAQDGLILLRKGAPSRSIPSRFYSFLDAAGKAPERRVHLSFRGLTLLGLDVQSVDQANHRIPNLAYTFFLEARRRLNANYQPIVFQVMDDKVIGCASIPLGLAWMPTSRWRPNHPYLVSLQPLETSWQTPGTASLYVSLRTAVTDPNLTCAALWAHHGQLRSIGTISLPFP